MMNGIFDTMRERWREYLTGGICLTGDGIRTRQALAGLVRRDGSRGTGSPDPDQEAGQLLGSMCREPGRSCLWPDLPDPGNVYARDRVCLKTCTRLEKLALRYASEGSVWEGDGGLKQEILEGLDFIYGNWYNENQRKGGEWWHREIGIPLCLNRIAVLLYDEMGAARLARLMRAVASWASNPDIMCIEDTPETSTGANRAWKCLVLAGCGILTRDMAWLERASVSIGDVFRFTRSGDGFYEDGSFVQHLKFAYNGGYGISFLKTMAEYIYLTAHTPWQVKAHEDEMMEAWIRRSFAPFLYGGCFMNMVNGRQVAREEYEEDSAGQEAAGAILTYASTLTGERREGLEKSLGQWMAAGSPDSAYFLFAGMDRAVCRRKGYAVGISMCSRRIGRYESIHGENLRGWHLSDGAVYLYNGDRTQFCGGFFPTVDAEHINGTTVDTLTREEKGVGFGLEDMPPNDWAGGCVLEGRYGSAGMELFAEGSSLTARKSWFLWEDEVVCLGAGISCDGGLGVVTVVENRKLPGVLSAAGSRGLPKTASALPMDLITANGKPVHPALGEGRRMEGVETLHLKGLVPDSDIGYYFPHRADIDLLVENRTDCWKSINSLQTSREPITNPFVEMLWDHGKDPVQERYEYIILPGKGREELREYAGNPPVDILCNTAQVQAVRHRGLKATGLHFWEKAGGEAAGIRCSARAAVLIREKEDSWVVSVSDPTWNNREGILLRLPFGADGVVRKPAEIQVRKLFPRAEIRVDTASGPGEGLRQGQFQADCTGGSADRPEVCGGTSLEIVFSKTAFGREESSNDEGMGEQGEHVDYRPGK